MFFILRGTWRHILTFNCKKCQSPVLFIFSVQASREGTSNSGSCSNLEHNSNSGSMDSPQSRSGPSPSEIIAAPAQEHAEAQEIADSEDDNEDEEEEYEDDDDEDDDEEDDEQELHEDEDEEDAPQEEDEQSNGDTNSQSQYSEHSTIYIPNFSSHREYQQQNNIPQQMSHHQQQNCPTPTSMNGDSSSISGKFYCVYDSHIHSLPYINNLSIN